jgi:hypothetical protein
MRCIDFHAVALDLAGSCKKSKFASHLSHFRSMDLLQAQQVMIIIDVMM